MTKIKKDDLPAEVVEYIEDLESSYDEAVEDAKTLAKALEEAQDTIAKQDTELLKFGVEKGDPLDAILAKADPAVAEVIKRQQAEADALKAQVAKTEQERIQREMIAKAEALPFITAEVKDLADILRIAYEVPTPVAKEGEQQPTPFGDKLVQVLTAANAQLMEGDLYKSFGNATTADIDPVSKVDGLAQELMKSDPKLDIFQARAAVYEQNPDLYEESLKES